MHIDNIIKLSDAYLDFLWETVWDQPAGTTECFSDFFFSHMGI